MYPLKNLYTKDHYLVTGWDSPRIEYLPKELGTEYPHLVEKYILRVDTSNEERKRKHLETKKKNICNRLSDLIKLINNHKHDYIAFIISELDNLQHTIVHTEHDIEKYKEVVELLECINNFIEFVIDKYETILFTSDHDLYYFEKEFNILYPLIEYGELELEIAVSSSSTLRKAVAKIYKNVVEKETITKIVLKKELFRKILVGLPGRVLGTKLYYRNVFPRSSMYGLFVSRLKRYSIDDLRKRYEELGLKTYKREELFHGPYLDQMPHLVFDQRSLGYIGLDKKLEKTLYLYRKESLHYPDGLFILYNYGKTGKYFDEYIKPWDVTGFIYRYLLDHIPEEIDGKCPDRIDCPERKPDHIVKKLLYSKKLRKILK